MTKLRFSTDDSIDETTLPEMRIEDLERAEREGGRDVQIRDFKDTTSSVTVAHGPNDPSRVWLSLSSGDTSVLLSLEEATARRLSDGLVDVLSRFLQVRSSVR